MRTGIVTVAVRWALSIVLSTAAADTPFKLGTFERNGRTFPGLVLEDRWVVDIAADNARLQKQHPSWKPLVFPAGMKELIERYADGLRERLHAIASEPGAATPRVDVYVAIDVPLRLLPPVAETVVN